MSLPATLLRIDQLQGVLAPQRRTSPAPGPTSTSGPGFAGQLTAAAAAPASGASLVTGALGSSALGAVPPAMPGAVAPALGAPAAAAGASGPGAAALAVAQGEVGVGEQPPGSNDGPRIAQYRQATAGSGVGPWCAYFVSWAARQAGAPLGEQGQGFGSVAAVADWAQRTGRSLPAGTVPAPGDLIVWGTRHIGLVESVDPDGSIHTVEGNSSDAVSRRTYGPDGGGATSYVRLG